MAKQKSEKATPPIQNAPRLYINLAIVGGGIIGLVLQAMIGMDDLQSFLFVGMCCLIAVAIVNYGWLIAQKGKRKG